MRRSGVQFLFPAPFCVILRTQTVFMKPSEAIVQQSDAIKAAAKKYGYTNLRVFGATSKGHDQDGAILYILGDRQASATPVDQTKLERDLRNTLKTPVIVLEESKLPKHMANEVAKGTIPI
jgi:predicted nucleotidyltransferase